MTSRVPVKSILKTQTPAPADAGTVISKEERDRQNLELALRHAHRIQHQKDVEAQILRVTEILMDYPSEEPFSAVIADRFTRLVAVFQPSDFDELAEERRIDGRCGYSLCSQEPQSSQLGDAAAWKVGFRQAAYCGGICARKAMYVKTQLSEIPAWERAPGQHPEIVLHEDDRPLRTDGSRRGDVAASRPRVDGDELLAFERGEEAASFRPRQVMTEKIVEKRHVEHQPLSSVHDAVVSHTAIEGYEPKVRRKGDHETTESDDEDGDSD